MNNKTSRLRRKINEMPDFIKKGLNDSCLMNAYNMRPPYQRNDYIGWITRAKREVIRQKRFNQMLDELELGNKYMNMDWKISK